MPGIFHPEDYSGNVQNCVNAASAAGGGLVEFNDMYTVSAAVNWPNNVHARANGIAGLKASGSSNITGLININGSAAGSGPSLTVGFAKYTNYLSLSAGHGLVAEDHIRIDATISSPAAYYHAFVTQLPYVASNDVNLGHILPFNLAITDTHTIRKLTMQSNIVIDGLTFDYGTCTAAIARGIWAAYFVDSAIRNCKFINFPSGGLVASSGMRNLIRDNRFIRCGGTECSWEVYAMTQSIIDGMIDDRSKYFGSMLGYCHHNAVGNILSNYANGRALKLWGSSMNSFGNIITSQPKNDGVSIQQNSCDNTFASIQANGSKSGQNGDSIGLKDNGQHNTGNTIVSVAAHGNVSRDITLPASSGNPSAALSYGTITT